MISSRFRVALTALVLWMCLGAPSAQAGDAAEALVRLLPGEPALCVVVEDLRGHAEKLREKGLVDLLFDSPLSSLLPQGLNRESVAELERLLQNHLQSNFEEIVEAVLGDALVLAYWPPRDNQPERSVILAKARSPDKAMILLKRLHTVQMQAGQVEKVETRTVGQASYFRLVEQGGQPQFQAIHEGVLVLTQEEQSVRRVLETLSEAPKETGFSRRYAALGREPALLRVLLSPRVFDADLASKAEAAPENEAVFLKEFLRYWQSIESLGLTLAIQPDLTLALHVQADVAKLPETARRALAEAAKPSALWNYVPANAMLALGGRCDVDALWDAFQTFLPTPGREQMVADLEQNTRALFGLGFRDDIIKHLGPDGIAYIAPPAGLFSVMPEVLLAVKIRCDEADRRRIESEWSDALKTLAGVIALARTQAGQPTSLRTRQTSFGRIVYLEGPGMPIPGMQPAGAIKDGCLVLALSPDTIIRFRRRDAKEFAAEKQTAPLLGLLNSKATLDMMVNNPVNRAALTSVLALMNGGNVVEANGRVETLRDLLKSFETVELRYRPQDNGGSVELRIRLAK
ncbi:MAG: DUF3352 domain-containing protein [Gemmatales bacterium]|nr:DUF3352 domain-containing protein [Gemmatales bacterium]MDW8386125.1 hypothetical protein [Gemmatales bacterium]